MGSMDRESVKRQFRFLAGNSGESENISTARYAWQSIHLPVTGFVDGDLKFEVWNQQSKAWTDAKDDAGAALATIAVVAGDVVPVPGFVNFVNQWRISMSMAQPDDLEFTVVNKT